MLSSFDKAYRQADPKVMAVSSCQYRMIILSKSRSVKECDLRANPFKILELSKQHCAKALLEFNGGHSCVQIYVNQHDFFMLHSKVNESAPLEGPNQ